MLPPELIAKLNDCSKANFVGERDRWFFLQSIFNWAVIAGLVLEGPELWYEVLSIVRSRIERFRYRIVLIENRLELAKVAAFVGWIFIIGGLFGELRASSKIVDFSAHIQECSDAKVQEVTIEAGDAATSAKTAHDEAAGVRKEATALRIQLGAVAKRAEDIDSDLARTQYFISGRSVTDFNALIKGLRQYRRVVVHFGSYNSEPDESMLCGELKSAAVSAQMSVVQDTCGRVVQVGTLLTGVVISGPDASQTVALAKLILHTSNLGPGGVASGIKAAELSIFVAAKPPFTIGQARGAKAHKSKQANKAKPQP